MGIPMMRSTTQEPLAPATGLLAAAAIAALLIFAVSASADDKKPQDAADEAAIRATVDTYVAAYNRGNAQAVATHWSENGEWISPSGKRVRGKQAIEKEMQALFAENKGVKIEVMHPAIRIVSPDVAIEEGTVRVIRPAERPSDSTYLAVHVKKGGKWQLDSVRETETPEASDANASLQELAWLVGEWIDDSPEATAEATVTWTKNKTFLSYTFKVVSPGMDDLEGTQIIGWDPAADTIRSWMFDSDGGFGEGVWTKKDNAWVVKFNHVLPDGRKASATNIYTLKDGNTFAWKSIGRKVDGQFLPNLDDMKMVRKTAGSASKEAAKAAPTPKKPGAKK
jgi:uncharacterized protein (TIGR02246 family)